MDFRQKCDNFLLTSRPYSWVGEIARGIFLGLYIHPSAPLGTAVFSATISLLMWLYFNWQIDWIQKDPGRISPHILLCYCPLFVTLILCFINANLTGTVGILVYVVTILLYAVKAKYKRMGILGPLFRIGTIFGQFAMICFAFHYIPDNSLILIVLVIAMFKGIRNLIGDIRDINTDKWEIPARYGINVSMGIIRLTIFSMVILSLFIQQLSILATSLLFFTISGAVLELFFWKFKNNAASFGYLAHRFLVISISVYLIVLTTFVGVPYPFAFLFIFLLVALQISYNLIPGKSYPSLRTMFVKTK